MHGQYIRLKCILRARAVYIVLQLDAWYTHVKFKIKIRWRVFKLDGAYNICPIINLHWFWRGGLELEGQEEDENP